MVRVAAMRSCVAVFLLFLAVLIGYCFTHKGNDEDVEGLLAREPLGELDVGHVPHAWHSDRIARLIDDGSCDELLVTILNTGDNAQGNWICGLHTPPKEASATSFYQWSSESTA